MKSKLACGIILHEKRFAGYDLADYLMIFEDHLQKLLKKGYRDFYVDMDCNSDLPVQLLLQAQIEHPEIHITLCSHSIQNVDSKNHSICDKGCADKRETVRYILEASHLILVDECCLLSLFFQMIQHLKFRHCKIIHAAKSA